MDCRIYNLTNAQKNIWNTELYYTGSNINNICGTINLLEPLNFDELKQALKLIIDENDNFHTNFFIKDGSVYQTFKDAVDCNIETVEINTKDDLNKLEQKMMTHIFDILNSSLFEVKIFKYPDNTGGVIVNIHHLISDSWTLGLIAKNIVSKYCAIHNKTEIPTNKNSYIDYINSENKYLNSSKFEKDKNI